MISKLSLQLLVNQPADDLTFLIVQPGEHVVELQTPHWLALTEIEAGVDGQPLAGGDELVEFPVFGRREDHAGLGKVAAGRERTLEIGMNPKTVGERLRGGVADGDGHRQPPLGQAEPHLEHGVRRPLVEVPGVLVESDSDP